MNASQALKELAYLAQRCMRFAGDEDVSEAFACIADVAGHIEDGTDPRASLNALRSAVYAMQVQ